jgi:hypothetical protein
MHDPTNHKRKIFSLFAIFLCRYHVPCVDVVVFVQMHVIFTQTKQQKTTTTETKNGNSEYRNRY